MFKKSGIVLISLVCISLLMSGCQRPLDRSENTNASAAMSQPTAVETDAKSGATRDRFRVGEVLDYQGTNLDPAIGPRDNSISGIQKVDIESYKLGVGGLVNSPVQMTYDEVLELTAYERLITLHCVEGWDATILWKGVLIKELIAKAGGAKPEAKTVIFHAVDGYTTSLSLFNIENWDIIMAYQANGLPLPSELGFPFIVVAENKFGYKWARWVDAIELSEDESYRGYWEQRGYSNNGSINEE